MTITYSTVSRYDGTPAMNLPQEPVVGDLILWDNLFQYIVWDNNEPILWDD